MGTDDASAAEEASQACEETVQALASLESQAIAEAAKEGAKFEDEPTELRKDLSNRDGAFALSLQEVLKTGLPPPSRGRQ